MNKKRRFSPHNIKTQEHYKQTTWFYKYFWSWGTFGMHAGFYDLTHLSPTKALDNTQKVLADLIHLTAEDKILDAGCGMGGPAVWIAKNIKAQVIGINISSVQLKIARKLAIEQGVNNLVTFKKMDYCSTNIPDQSFDVVWALDSVCHAENKQAFINEAFRLLKPQGRLIVCDGFLSKPRAEFKPFTLKLLKVFEEGYNIGELVPIGEFKAFIKKAGFKKAEFIDKSRAARPNWWLGFLICSLCYIPFKVLQKLKLINQPALLKLGLTGIIQPFGELIGLGHYGVFLAQK